MKYYEQFCYIKPLPWGEPIPIQALYTACQCTVTNVNGDVSHRDSDFLSTPEFNCDSTNRVIIIADLGYGKTTFIQHLVSDWVSKMKTPKIDRKDKIREPILIYVHLKEVDPSMILSDLVEKMMPVGIDIMADDIVEIFMNFEFQVLLDGLNELPMSTICANTSPEINDKEEARRVRTGNDVQTPEACDTLEKLSEKKVNNESIEKDIKSLKACLGKIAFENKESLSPGKREYWNNNLGKEDTELALAIGLLKYSKQVRSGDFLAAQYVLEEDKECAWIDEFIPKQSDNATVRLLQFMFGLNHAKLDKAVKALIKDQKMWNNLIDCFYELSNLKKKQSIVNDMIKEASIPGGSMVINIHDLNRKHHKFALKDFCDACKTYNLKLGQLTFREECAIDFIRETTMPSLRLLTFLDMTINENQFVSIITSLTNKKCPEILQFENCSVPDELKGEAKHTVESALKGLGMKRE
ncbi:hypothetical protein BSL78_09914 [Apostichopus japonicus]|uniref:NACHT domain-containing protein n=1 Tax=Stichopus japonicus TaxID=307972 RepID=A0A2G8KS57_STIJA|nr:hypothetical protein BSL78_12356 [Apostichopus japonicus]PIK53204.1 hypothetical protein BSL78_09914 [Apostichopus japonicus]